MLTIAPKVHNDNPGTRRPTAGTPHPPTLTKRKMAEWIHLREELLSLYAQCKAVSNGNNRNENTDSTNDDGRPTVALTEHVHDVFDRLMRVPITKKLLELTGGAKILHKFATKLDGQKFPTVTRRAKALRLRMMAKIGPTGQKETTLIDFRNRVNELKERSQCKPDMVAYRELRTMAKHRFDKTLGLLEDVPVGTTLEGRGEAAILGIHTNILSGIDAEKDTPCYAVCVSGKYEDDDSRADFADGDGIILYTGSGGQNKRGQQVKDQTENIANQSLILSSMTGDPIRVLRRMGHAGLAYRYEGLYECTSYNYEPSSDGPMVYKFTLKPLLNGQSMFSIRKDLQRYQGDEVGSGQQRESQMGVSQ